MIVVGVPIGLLTPFPFIPIGLIVVLMGAALLVRNSSAGKRWIENMINQNSRIQRLTPNWLIELVMGEVENERDGKTDSKL